jgi:hypothetical protein
MVTLQEQPKRVIAGKLLDLAQAISLSRNH